MIRPFLLMLILGLTGAPTSANAGSFTARIEKILIYEPGLLVYVYPEGGVIGAPACHGSNGNYTSFSLSRPHAKTYLAALLLAQSTAKPVTFYTEGVCREQSVSDTLSYITINS